MPKYNIIQHILSRQIYRRKFLWNGKVHSQCASEIQTAFLFCWPHPQLCTLWQPVCYCVLLVVVFIHSADESACLITFEWMEVINLVECSTILHFMARSVVTVITPLSHLFSVTLSEQHVLSQWGMVYSNTYEYFCMTSMCSTDRVESFCKNFIMKESH
jgi:hypothetical protein